MIRTILEMMTPNLGNQREGPESLLAGEEGTGSYKARKMVTGAARQRSQFREEGNLNPLRLDRPQPMTWSSSI